MPTYEYGGQTWEVLPWVRRKREVRLLHPEADTIDGYRCRWPNTLEDSAENPYRYSALYDLRKDPNTGILHKDADGAHSGVIYMHLTPGQDPSGEVRCQAMRMEPREARTWTIAQAQAWQAEHPGEQVQYTWSGWSNPRDVGPVSPDPVPELIFTTGLLLGLLALAILFKVFRRKH